MTFAKKLGISCLLPDETSIKLLSMSLFFGYIYLITNTVNGKRYIGKTARTVEKRWAVHKNSRNDKRLRALPINRAIRKYGVDAFRVETILTLCKPTKKECDAALNAAERGYIVGYQSHFSTGHGYNMSWGGEGGDMFTDNPRKESIRERMRMRITPELSKKMKEARKVVFIPDNRKEKHGLWKPLPKEAIEFCIRNQHSLTCLARNLGISDTALARKVRYYFGQTVPMLRKVWVLSR